MKTQIAKIMDIELNTPRMQDETSQELIQRVCFLFIMQLEKQKGFSPLQLEASVAEEIEQEVLEVFRMKIYGYYSLSHYRQAKLNGKVS